MSEFGCAEVRDLAPELALGLVSGAPRADALQHLSGCGPCRTLVGELSEAADALPLLAAEAEPPPGFEKRVFSGLKAHRRRKFRRAVAAVAAVAAASAILSITGVRVVESRHGSTRAAPPAPPRAVNRNVRTATMVGAGGLQVGDVYVSDGRPSAVYVNVDYRVATGSYRIELRAAGERVVRLGEVQVYDGRGSWGGVAKLPVSGSAAIVLVDQAGNTVCEAHLPRVA